MKKSNIIYTIIISVVTLSAYAQSGQKWATGGNSNATGDFLGTTNNFSIDFKTNNVLRMSLGTNGVLKINNLAGVGTRLLQVDPSGSLIQLPQGTSNQYLSGNGTWVNIPSGGNFWSANGTSLFYNNGYVGIGTNTPLFPLDVIGDARISNNLYVGGGIVITDKVRATGDIKTGRLDADTIKLDASRIITGETNVFGDTKLKFKLDVSGPSTFNDLTQFNQQVNVQSNLNTLGNAYFDNNVQLNRGFTFDGANGISMTPGNGTHPKIFRYGNPNGTLSTNCAASPQAWANHQFGGMIQIFDGADPLTTGLLNFQTFGPKSFIDASDAGNTGGGSGLLLNYFCGNDVSICQGVNGGKVQMGKIVEIGFPTSDVNTNLNIKTTNGSTTKAISVKNYQDNEVFYIGADGRTAIGDNYIPSGYMLAVKGKIIAEEVLIQLKPNWPDYVFNKNYNLAPLSDVETYIKKNHHLEGFKEAKEYEQSGISTSEIILKQQEKIEELTLYLIELDKKIKLLEKK